MMERVPRRAIKPYPLPINEAGFLDGIVNSKHINLDYVFNSLRKMAIGSLLERIDDTMSCAYSDGSYSGSRNNSINLSSSSGTNCCENLEGYCSDADSYFEQKCGEEGLL
ncbi:hypothetical protein CRYUN_Cryun28dG0012500 [Craigia yunnanensis]